MRHTGTDEGQTPPGWKGETMMRRGHRQIQTVVTGLALAGLTFLGAGSSSAQPAAPRPRDARTEREVDRELAHTMERLMVLRLSKHLQLTEEQERGVVPLIKEITQLRRQHTRKRREAIRTLGAMSRDPGTDDGMIRQRLESFNRDDETFRRQERETLDEIRSNLDPRQQARFLAFEEHFREEIRRRIEDARHRGGRMAPRRPSVDRQPPRPRPR